MSKESKKLVDYLPEVFHVKKTRENFHKLVELGFNDQGSISFKQNSSYPHLMVNNTEIAEGSIPTRSSPTKIFYYMLVSVNLFTYVCSSLLNLIFMDDKKILRLAELIKQRENNLKFYSYLLDLSIDLPERFEFSLKDIMSDHSDYLIHHADVEQEDILALVNSIKNRTEKKLSKLSEEINKLKEDL